MEIIKSANLALRFLLELCALGYWGFKTGSGLIVKFAFGIGAPLLAAVVWGTFVAPGASTPGPLRLGLELAVFGLGAAGLVATGHRTLVWMLEPSRSRRKLSIRRWRRASRSAS